MTRLKPDQFQQMVGTRRHIARDGMGYILLESTAVQLLRLYHRRVVRLVKRQQGWERDGFCNMTTQLNALWLDRHELLAALTQLKKGK